MAIGLELAAEGLSKVLDLVGRLGGVQSGQILGGDQRVDGRRAAFERRRVLLAAQLRRADLVG